MDELPVFRAAKRRKFVRQKGLNAESSPQVTEDSPAPLPAESARSESEDVDVSSLIKARRQAKFRNAGVQFSNTRLNSSCENESSNMVVPLEQTEDQVKQISNRFIGSTGQVVDVDKHMMAFIDSEMARRRQNNSPQVAGHQTGDESDFSSQSEHDLQESNPSKTSKAKHLPNSHQLSEVDLGPSATTINSTRTEQALARAQAGLPIPAEQEKVRKPRKPRLGRDGKPMRPRPRKRRNSADVARDALVEQVLHEHALDVYDKTADRKREGEDTANDEQFAEEFRQQFLDAMADRQQRQKAVPQTGKPGITNSVPQGPKMGGGRMGRAIMAAMQAQQNTDKGK